MKKLLSTLAVVLVLAMCISLVVACDSKKTDDPNSTTSATTTAATTTATTATETTTTTAGNQAADPDNSKISEPTVDVPSDGIIKTAEQLHAVLVNGASEGDYTVQADELDMAKYTWTGLSNYSGTFDFGGCVIKNAADSLFISVHGGTVKNLTIADSVYVYTNDDATADVSARDEATVGNKIYSPVVRYATDITVSNITVESSVTVSADIYEMDSHHGGIVGETNGSFVVIENCTFKGTYTSDSSLVNFGNIVGKVYSNDPTVVNMDEPEKSTVRIVNCFNYGKLENKSVAYDSKVAGIVGYAENVAIIGCANYGDVINADDGQTGGVAGYVYQAICMKNCLNTGNVSGNTHAGGIVAYSNCNGSERPFINCANLGKVTATGAAGGFVGIIKSSEKLTNCFNLSSATAVFGRDADSKEIKPTDPSTTKVLVISNSDNVDDVATMFSMLNAVAPDVFAEKDGSLVIVVK